MFDAEAAWGNPQNWTSFGYRCPEDPRVIVPKRVRALGYTLNWAHPRAGRTFALTLLIALTPPMVLNAVVGFGLGELWMGAHVAQYTAMTYVAMGASLLAVLAWCRHHSRLPA